MTYDQAALDRDASQRHVSERLAEELGKVRVQLENLEKRMIAMERHGHGKPVERM